MARENSVAAPVAVSKIPSPVPLRLTSVARTTVFFFALAILLQWLLGAYRAPFSGYPDEPAHFTTGLMLRDYVAQGFPSAPIRYAENYYIHYPKVAIGHWPPLFHILEAIWLLILPVGWSSVMVLMALYCAIDAALVHWWVAQDFGNPAGYATAALFVLLPLVRGQTAMVMTEGLLMIFVLLAVFAYARYLESGSWRPAVLFGIFASLSIFVKGNAWSLALVPPIAILLTRRFSLIRRWPFWAPAPIVLLLCMPWQMATAHLVEHGWDYSAGLAYFGFALGAFAQGLWLQMTPPVIVLALAGIAATVMRRRAAPARAGSMLALILAVLIFHAITPTGPEMRHIICAVPALLTFVPAGVIVIVRFFRSCGFVLLARPAVVAGIAGLFFAVEAPAVAPVRSFGFEQAAAWLTSRPELRDAVALVSSNCFGEGIMIAETAMRERRPGHYILRATKLLADVDWSGTHYAALFGSADEVRSELNLVPIDVLVIDFTPAARLQLHHEQLLQMLSANPAEWKFAQAFGPKGGDARPVRIYVRVGPRGPDHLRPILADQLHRIEEQWPGKHN